MKACQPQGVGKSSGFHAQLPATKCKTGHAWPCELMRGHDWSCMLMRGHAWPCMVMRGHACTCVVMSGHACSCVVMRGHAWPCVCHVWTCVLMHGHEWSCVVMHGHAWPCMLMHAHAWSCVLMHDRIVFAHACSLVSKQLSAILQRNRSCQRMHHSSHVGILPKKAATNQIENDTACALVARALCVLRHGFDHIFFNLKSAPRNSLDTVLLYF